MGRPKIKVIGVGGGGSNAVNRMIELGLGEISFLKKVKERDLYQEEQETKADISESLSYYATNTDLMALEKSLAPFKIQLGPTLTRGLGAGGKPEVGEKAAEESEEALKSAFEDTDLLIIAAGMGGGTGTGAAPVVAKIAKSMGILSIGFVTRPFEFEGKPRRNNAEEGIRKLRENVDALITINNQRLLLSKNKDYEIDQAFLMADDALRQGIQGICEIVYEYDVVNADFQDLESILRDSGDAYMGIGCGKGQKRAVEAVQRALNSDILEYSIKGARNLLVNVRGGKSFKISEAEEATNAIRKMVHPECNIIWGAGKHDKLGEELQITVIASGFIRNQEPIDPSQSSEDEHVKTRNGGLIIPDIMTSIDQHEPFFKKYEGE
jgi:cell division protein FtsZ